LSIGILALTAVMALVATLFVPPIAQDPAYHDLADRRSLLGIANFGDVTSNAGFLVVGLLGLRFLAGRPGTALLPSALDRWPYAVFFAGVATVAVGSGYYHLAPSNDTLLWDRLPMTAAFMALFAAFVADRIARRVGAAILLPVLLALGVASVVYWHVTEAAGHGDLRFYALVQFYPMLAIPLMCWLFPGRHTSGRSVVYILLWYGLAKLCEHFDAHIYDLLAHTLSGHSLKHLFAALAVYMVLSMLRHADRSRGPAATG
jgi:hypothetical protein